MDISIVGTGAVGLSWARAICDSGLDLRLSLFDPQAPPAGMEWALQQGLPIHATHDAAPHGEVVLLCTPGGVLPQVLQELLPALESGTCLLDLSTATPADKADGASRAAENGIGYIDAAITGAVALSGVRTPLLIAGSSDDRVSGLLESLAVPVTLLTDSHAGDAVRVKLLRSVITKGIEALAADMLPVARDLGLLDQVLSVFEDIDRKPFTDLLTSMVTTHIAQAGRRGSELTEAAEQLERAGADPTLTRAVAARYGRTVELTENEPLPQNFDQALDLLAAAQSHAADRIPPHTPNTPDTKENTPR